MDVELTPVREAHKFDAAALETYLNQHVEDFAGPLTIKQFEGGQSNPTFQLITPTRRYVLRKQPPGELYCPPRTRWIASTRLWTACGKRTYPCRKMYCLCEDTNRLSAPSFMSWKWLRVGCLTRPPCPLRATPHVVKPST